MLMISSIMKISKGAAAPNALVFYITSSVSFFRRERQLIAD